MTLSRKDIRPWQTKHLLDRGMLPVSLDYRLCPEINLVNGAMTDVRDAVAWARNNLPTISRSAGVLVDPYRIVVVGWSTGATLAMSLAWTAPAAGIQPPNAILAFYGPSDYEAKGVSPSLEQHFSLHLRALMRPCSMAGATLWRIPTSDNDNYGHSVASVHKSGEKSPSTHIAQPFLKKQQNSEH